LLPYDLPRHIEAQDLKRNIAARPPKRKEIEARRYNGKEPVAEYLLQFELTARRNGWSYPEKTTSLLCALDGLARSLFAEIDDIDAISFAAVKNLLTKRFGPISLPDVHEQALQDLKLSRGQPIREITTEVSRLIKLAYPEFDTVARERLAVKARINATNDKDTMFYIKEKDPQSLEEVCALYERYNVLTGHSPAHLPAVVKATKPEGTTEAPANNAVVSALQSRPKYTVNNWPTLPMQWAVCYNSNSSSHRHSPPQRNPATKLLRRTPHRHQPASSRTKPPPPRPFVRAPATPRTAPLYHTSLARGAVSAATGPETARSLRSPTRVSAVACQTTCAETATRI